MNRSKTRFENKLLAYSAVAAGVIVAPQCVDAQILYTDLYEDIQKGDTSSYVFNINEDEYHDLMIFQGFLSNGNVIQMQLGDSVEVLGSTAGQYFYPFAIDFAYSIDGNNSNWFDWDFGTMNWQGSNNYGNWQGVEDKFVAIKIILDGKNFYGWARLDVSLDAKKFVVKDYAVEFTTGKAIITGDGFNTYGVTELMASDQADNNNPSDMQIGFKKAAEENKVAEYRIILVSADDTEQLTPSVAISLPSSKYIKVAKTGSDIQLNLPLMQQIKRAI